MALPVFNPLTLSAPVALPVKGDAGRIKLVYDLGKVLDSDWRTLDILGAFADQRSTLDADLRALREAWRTTWLPVPARDTPEYRQYAADPSRYIPTAGDAHWGAYRAAQTEYMAATRAITVQIDALNREANLALIADCVVSVEWPFAPPLPVPADPGSWDAVPDHVVEWIATLGREVAAAQLTDPKSAAR